MKIIFKHMSSKMAFTVEWGRLLVFEEISSMLSRDHTHIFKQYF